MILFLAVYLLVVLYNTFVKPFNEGYAKSADGRGGKKAGNVIITYNPEKGRKPSKGAPDDYVDYEEVKDE